MDAASSMTHAPPLKLGYVVIESERLDDWQRFAGEGLGMHVDRLSEDRLAIRIDDRQRRILVERGPIEDVVSLGWELADEAAFRDMRSHLLANGIAPSAGSFEAAEARAVSAFFSFEGHKGLRFEFFTGARRTNQQLSALTSGFVTGAGGLGHAVMFTRKPEELIESLQRLLGARLSDTITDRLQGLEMEFWFLHLNERHHSLAVAATKGVRLDPLRTRIQHLMFEAASLNDVSDAYLRCKVLGYRIAMGMGQHPNDHGVSFYAVSPSGFEVELGFEPVRIGADWDVKEYRGISKWGHQPEFIASKGERFETIRTALKSLFRN
jgi:2,3-dihydroxybiphenyl 1,2-dioxygenase